MDPESQNNIAFGSIYNNRVSMSDDTESGMLDYSKPEYASNFATYVDSKISPLIQPYDNSMQTMKFSIGSLEDPYYSDLSTLRCIGRLQVLHSDGSPLKKDEAISVCNLFPETIFSQCNVYISGLPVSDHGRGSHFKSYIQKHYSCSKEVKSITLANNYYQDDEIRPGQLAMEQVTVESMQGEPGIIKRAKFIEQSKDVLFTFKPTFDLMSSEQALPPSYVLNLEFERNNESFSLITHSGNQEQYKIRLFDFHLELRRFIPSKSAISQLPNPRSGTHFLSFTRQTVRFRAIHAGVTDINVPQIADSNGILPYSIMIIPLSTDQSTNISKNPFIFWPKWIKKYNLLLNSSSLPGQALTVEGDHLDNGRAFNHFLENTNMGGTHSSNGISPFTYRYKDWAMVWDLCSDLCNGAHRHRPTSGKIHLM